MLPFPEIETIAEPPIPVVEPGTPWGWWVAAVAGALIVLGLGIWLIVGLWRRASIPAAPARPEKLAMRDLKALRKSAAGMAPGEFAAALSGCIRSFMHRRMGLLAHYSTTPELLGRSHSAGAVPPPPLTELFSGVLEACDAMKFGAGAAPDRAALIAAAEAAMQTVKRSLSTPPPAPQLPVAAAEISPPSA